MCIRDRTSFKYPEESYVFPWVSEDNRVFIGRFYHREKVKYKVHIFIDLMGNNEEIPDNEFEDKEDEMLSNGFDIRNALNANDGR